MTRPISFGRLDFELVSSMTGTKEAPYQETPFRLLIMGDFSGRTKRDDCSQGAGLKQRRVLQVDRDTLDETMAKVGVEIRLPLMGEEAPPTTIRFSEIDDFHPDRLFARLEIFRDIRENRKKVADPDCFARMLGARREKSRTTESPSATATEESMMRVAGQSSGSLLDQILEETESGPTEGARAETSEWGRFLDQIVLPHLVPDISRSQTELLGRLDAATGDLMRAILHYPDFQELEATWRGLDFLVSRLETGEDLRLYLLDVAKSELADDLGGAGDLKESGIYRQFVQKTVATPGAEPWALLTGLYTFDDSREDVELLGRIAQIAGAAGAPFIAAASERIVGCASLAQTPYPNEWRAGISGDIQAWAELRDLPAASYLGLVLPRFLLRLPYGGDTEPIDLFDFEEMTVPPEHGRYLWGNPALVVAALLGQTFSDLGWGMRPGAIQDVEGLPLHVYKIEGESLATPCAEVLLTEVAVDIIMDRG